MTHDSKLIPIAIGTQHSTLLIISHTEHFRNPSGQACGWIPTIREIDYLAAHFKEIVHVAVLYPEMPPASTTPYTATNVRFVGIPPFGGTGIKNKLLIFWVLPQLLHIIRRELKTADLFQFRAPTSIGIFVIPFLTVFSKKQGWYKYAGNWLQPNMPKSYRIQKWMLEKGQKRPVTINGRWPDQPPHVHTFENPCLSDAELTLFKAQGHARVNELPYTACFVGRLDAAKGVDRIVNLLLQPDIEKTIGHFHFVGDGLEMENYKTQLEGCKVAVVFHGFCSREATFDIYAKSHLFLLPSKSEGFPKVVAEAAAFGCVPIVSDVSSIGQYIGAHNGYLWPIGKIDFTDFVLQQDFSRAVLANKSAACYSLAESFTFEHFFKKLVALIKIQ